MMGLIRASTVVPLIEQGVIVEGELIQIASEKRFSPSDYSSLASMRFDVFLWFPVDSSSNLEENFGG